MKARTVTIIGLGRTGTSLGLALKAAKTDLHVIGYDKDQQVLKQAEELKAVDATSWKLIPGVMEADILVLTVPGAELRTLLRTIGNDVQAHALVLDMSRPKAKGQEWAAEYLRAGHYVGVQPIYSVEALLGSTDDLTLARADLFKNSVYCLMPSVKADPKAVETAVNLGLLIGGRPFFIDAVEYDNLSQAVQTLPGLVAAALFRAVSGASGWRDMLRFAQTPFAQATLPLEEHGDVALMAIESRVATLRWLDALTAELQEMRTRVHEGDTALLAALLEKTNVERERWLEERRRNDWQEGPANDYETPGFLEQMVGWRRKKDD